MIFFYKLYRFLLFADILVLLKKRDKITIDDFSNIPSDDYNEEKVEKFVFYMSGIFAHTRLTIVKSLIRNNFLIYSKFLFLSVFMLVLTLLMPIFLSFSLKSIEDNNVYSIIVFSSLLLVTLIVRSFIFSHASVFVQRYFIINKRMLVRLILNKVLSLSVNLDDRGSGEIHNLVGDDANNAAHFPRVMMDFFLIIAQLIGLSVILCWQLGGIALIGIALLVVSIVIQTRLMSYLNFKLQKSIKYKDKRVSVVGELIKKFRSIRATGIADFFIRRINEAREEEVAYLLSCHIIYSIMQIVMLAAPLLISILTFSLYLSQGGNLEISKVFSAIALFTLLRSPMMMISGVFFEISGGLVAIDRLKNFLNQDEVYTDLDDKSISSGAVDVSLASLKNNGRCIFEDLCLSVKPGELIVITGETGSGKTALLNMIAGYDKSFNGVVRRNGFVSYLQHYMWLANDSLKNNILFGREFDEKLYSDVLRVCGLNYDIAQLQGGDATLLGELGSKLSGGQQQRVALARAIYSQSDILLLDNPTSALDPEVSNQICSDAIVSFCKKTRIVVTNNPILISKCDRAFEMKNGNLIPLDISNYSFTRQQSKSAVDSFEYDSEFQTEMYDEEKIQRGNADWALLKSVFKQSGSFVVLISIALFVGIAETLRLIGEIYLAGESNNINGSIENFFYAYWCIGLASFTAIVISQILLYTRVVNHTKNSHRMVLDSVVNAPMLFFDKNPQGRIINRFSNDIDVCSGHLMVNLFNAIYVALSLVVQVVFVSIKIPLFIVVVIVITILYWQMQKNYRLSARSVRRIQSVLRSPLYSSVSEAIRGATALKLNKIEFYAVNQVMQHLENDLKGVFTAATLQSWLRLRQGILSAAIVASIICLILFFGGGIVGALALTYAVLASSTIAQLISNLAIVEWDLNSAWRIGEYSNLDREVEGSLSLKLNEITSPVKVTFNSVYLSYFSNHHSSLKNISFSVNPGEKLGICGRSGAGKSSISNALLSMYPIQKGRILFNDVDIKNLGAKNVRNYVSVLTQTPLIFSGSIRENIDPDKKYTDEKIQETLDKVDLNKRIQQLHMKLESDIDEIKLSSGEVQLLVLARLMLENCPIILLDEPTSDIDKHLLSDVMERLYTERPEATVILISHHLSTLMQMDKVIVMEQGKIIEFGNPSKLMNDIDSKFFKLFNAYEGKSLKSFSNVNIVNE